MRFKDALEKIEGLKFISDTLSLQSQPGRQVLIESEFLTDILDLQKAFKPLEQAVEIIESGNFSDSLSRLSRLLMQIRDISHTVMRLEKGDVPDDVELFEIKCLAIRSEEIRNIISSTPLDEFEEIVPPSLTEAKQLLDPENTGNTSFYIYDCYSKPLAEKRKELKRLQSSEDYDQSLSDRLTGECLTLENEVRSALGDKLRPLCTDLRSALDHIGALDLLLAKASMAVELNLHRPSFNNEYISYSRLRYLPVESRLKASNRSFQPVDITLKAGVTLITGANMGGKTITLKSLALSQALAQFVFYCPAEAADIKPVADIFITMGDSQSASSGLSSFGSEILKTDSILKQALTEDCFLILIDEPARTTNPEEGRAIVNSIAELLGNLCSFTAITTHYSGIQTSGCRLKVKGLKDIDSPLETSGKIRLEEYIDYSLVAEDSEEIDREALRIARLLGISSLFADTIQKHIERSR